MRAAPLVVFAVWASGCGSPPASEARATDSGADGRAHGGEHEGGEAAVDGGETVDASAPGDARPAVDAAFVSRCHLTPPTVACDHQAIMLADATGMREVAFATPLGPPAPGGFPAVVYFQGSFVPGHSAFAASESDAFGMYELTLTIKALLDRGFAVIAPDAASNGSTFWQTNIPPYAQSWPGSSDDVLLQNLFAAIGKASFGPIDGGRLYAMGISSGGFMTSRMAVSYPGRFRALADHSGSYATCSAACSVPTPLPSDHPPTLFLHGDADTIVPMTSVQPYLDALVAEGHVAQLVTDADAGHQWLAAGVQAIPAWFDAHP